MEETNATGSRSAAAKRDTFSDALSRRLWPLTSESLLARARRRTGLTEFGDPPLQPALSILLRSLEEEANLHPLGRFLMHMHLRSLLETRLRLIHAWSGQTAALAASPVKRPLFIIGMPRSGSTFLHELLAEDPENRAPRIWEVMFPVPAPRPATRSRDLRIWKAAASLWWFRQLAPRADAVFPMRALTPHECVAIHSYTLVSEEFVSTCRIPAYEAFLRVTDLTPAYAWQKRFLQHLQLHCPRQRWVFKSPDHVYGLEPLFSVFPDATIIQTHRNPLAVLKSSSQLTQVLRGLFARPGDTEPIGAREARMLAQGMERITRFRDIHPELSARFLDVKYSELVSDPLAVISRIYEQLDWPLTEAARERIRRMASRRTRYRRSRVSPSLADLGLDPATEAQRFESYCSRFGVSCQQAELSR